MEEPVSKKRRPDVPVDTRSRLRLARILRSVLDAGPPPGTDCPSSADPAIREIHRALLTAPKSVPCSPVRRRRIERAILFLETDLPWIGPTLRERMLGAAPTLLLAVGFASVFVAVVLDLSRPFQLAALGVLGLGCVILFMINIWILILALGPAKPDTGESPEERWPFPSRRSFEERRDAQDLIRSDEELGEETEANRPPVNHTGR
ncbi:MAG: hypothetical protein RL885_19975 [Planctomycetota bacterium]